MRLLAVSVLLSSTLAAADSPLAWDDGDRDLDRPGEMWLPWGVLDRMQIAPARLSLTTELGTHDGADTATTTLHAQISTSCQCGYGAYFTLPLAYAFAEPTGLAAAGSTLPQPARIGWRTADVGVFFSPRESHHDSLWRVGALLPTASAMGPRTISARAGDMVLELPRSAGARFSASHLFGFLDLPRSWFGTRTFGAIRWDTGLDLAYELDAPAQARRLHVVPHAGVGAQFVFRPVTVSIDSVLAMDPTDQGDMNVRWSTGVTGQLGSPAAHAGSWFRPALTLALVRTPDGWGGTVAIDLTATRHRKATYAGS